jgi:polar amino acid transport system substrate-binding protein
MQQASSRELERSLMPLMLVGWCGRALRAALLATSGFACFAQAPAETSARKLVMVNAIYAPYINAPGHSFGPGIDVEIAQEALRRAGYVMELKIVPWKRVLLMLEHGEADFTTSIGKSGDRDAYLAWTSSYRKPANYRFYSRKDAKGSIRSLGDLNDKRLGVVAGFYYPPALLSRERTAIVQGPNMTGVIKMLEAGRSDVIVASTISGTWEIRELGLGHLLKLHPYEHPASETETFMAFSRKTEFTKPLADVTRVLLDMGRDGTTARIVRKYQDASPKK